MKSSRIVFASIILSFLSLVVVVGDAFAQVKQQYTLPSGRPELVTLPDDFTNVSISDKSVVRVIKHGGRKISLVGKKSGKSQVSLYKGPLLVYHAHVQVGADMLGIEKALRDFFPQENVTVRLVNNSVALSGVVTDAEIASRLVTLAKQYLAKANRPTDVVNLMQIRTGNQVMLRVRVGEVQRGAIGKLGVGAGAGAFDTLVRNGVLKILAEPNLTAISGEEAEFLAGGEFPVPVAQSNNAMSVEYKPYGVSVKFTPTVISQNRIRLTVHNEVSEISSAGSVQMNGTSLPSISSRRAKTTVELAPGESFMIAGLIRDVALNSSHSESELVISVTPYLVNPVAANDLKLPTDNFAPGALEGYFRGALGKRSGRNTGVENKIHGSHGFMVQ